MDNFSFVIISPEYHFGRIRSTVGCIKGRYPNVPFYCVVPKHIDEESLEEIRQICPVHVGKDTVTSLMNVGYSVGEVDWKILVMEGSNLQYNINRKLSLFIDDEKDVLFAICPDRDRSNRITSLNNTFFTSTLNGLTIHRKTFEDVGKFSDNPLEISRAMWAMDAQDKSCKFKGILGMKIL